MGSFALAEMISHIKSSQMSASCRNRKRNVGYQESCRIPNPGLTLHIGFVPLPNHLVKHLSNMKMFQLGGDCQYLLFYFTKRNKGWKQDLSHPRP